MNAAALVASDRARLLRQLQDVVSALEDGDEPRADAGLEQVLRLRDSDLFASVARLTRSLHRALVELRMDERLEQLAGHDMPDASSRLDYVVRMTEDAAHRTLELVENARACLAQVEAAGANVAPLRAILTQLAMAQEYQDISGQVIKRVITMVRDVECALLDLLRAAGAGSAPLQKTTPRPIAGLSGPAVPGGPAAANQQDADALLASLGF